MCNSCWLSKSRHEKKKHLTLAIFERWHNGVEIKQTKNMNVACVVRLLNQSCSDFYYHVYPQELENKTANIFKPNSKKPSIFIPNSPKCDRKYTFVRWIVRSIRLVVLEKNIFLLCIFEEKTNLSYSRKSPSFFKSICCFRMTILWKGRKYFSVLFCLFRFYFDPILILWRPFCKYIPNVSLFECFLHVFCSHLILRCAFVSAPPNADKHVALKSAEKIFVKQMRIFSILFMSLFLIFLYFFFTNKTYFFLIHLKEIW